MYINDNWNSITTGTTYNIPYIDNEKREIRINLILKLYKEDKITTDELKILVDIYQ